MCILYILNLSKSGQGLVSIRKDNYTVYICFILTGISNGFNKIHYIRFDTCELLLHSVQ